ncbi:nucleotide exchange factor GrpE [Oscillatoria sp. FACHB-1407]|uniref:nucleotide exchange factor GrpE n=1 Tax=Oscillatoria sp. FACHB-1407 TaxID=2692847 RepID=UPI0016839A41|nr:nucleotide exchange factor GrpE [Oscillatoria sp. FACHB-1407]MBD2462083.1 nucleotide exchange factor GrpE [Oscillatoria sp. FACHB-1407]
MSRSSAPDYTHRLRSLMQSVGVLSFKALSRLAGVSEWQVQQLRQGRVAQMQVGQVQKLAEALGRSLPELLELFSEESELSNEASQTSPTDALEAQITDLKQEYQRLQTQLAEQQDKLRQEFQQTSLQALESLLLQLPTAIYAAQQNPQVPATRLVPLLRPIDQLLQSWGIEAIAPVGEELAYDPQHHQLMEGSAQPGDRVRVRYTGYRQGERLLYRAKVSPINKE